jgi:hypothetical protein
MNACVETVPSSVSSKIAIEVEVVARGESTPARLISGANLADFHRAPVTQPSSANRSWFPARWLRARNPYAQGSFALAMPVEALPGVGHAYSRTLVQHGVTTVGQLRRIPKPVLVSAFGKAIGRHIWQCARS